MVGFQRGCFLHEYAELKRLDWREIHFKPCHIEIKSKTAQRRLAPLLPNLKVWLKSYRNPTGPVCPTHEVETEGRELAKTLEIPWPNNALRPSYASYRMASADDLSALPKVGHQGRSHQVVPDSSGEVGPLRRMSIWAKCSPLSFG